MLLFVFVFVVKGVDLVVDDVVVYVVDVSVCLKLLFVEVSAASKTVIVASSNIGRNSGFVFNFMCVKFVL